jgi:hypothetical protein
MAASHPAPEGAGGITYSIPYPIRMSISLDLRFDHKWPAGKERNGGEGI